MLSNISYMKPSFGYQSGFENKNIRSKFPVNANTLTASKKVSQEHPITANHVYFGGVKADNPNSPVYKAVLAKLQSQKDAGLLSEGVDPTRFIKELRADAEHGKRVRSITRDEALIPVIKKCATRLEVHVLAPYELEIKFLRELLAWVKENKTSIYPAALASVLLKRAEQYPRVQGLPETTLIKLIEDMATTLKVPVVFSTKTDIGNETSMSELLDNLAQA